MWKSATTPTQYVAILGLVLFSSLVIFLTPISSSGVSVASADIEVQTAIDDRDNTPWFKVGEHIENAFNAVISGILTAIITMVGGLMTIAGTGFDYAISYTILEFSKPFEVISEGVSTVWGGFRDISNIIMIAMYVFVAFSVMFGIETYGLKSLGLRILIVALLINFSLFFTKVVVDISNRTAAQFNSAIKVPGGGPVSTADIFFRATGITKTGYKDLEHTLEETNLITGAYGTLKGIDGLGAKLLYTFTLVLLYSVLTAVFIYGMLLLIIRMVTLIVLMFTSSLAFATRLIPKVGSKWWDKWWGALLQNALFAPLLMMMLWATAQIVTKFKQNDEVGGDVIGELAKGTPGSWEYLMQMMIVIGLLYASIKVSSNLATFGGKFVQNMSMKGLRAGLAFGLVTPTANLALRAGVRIRNDAARGAGNILSRVPGFRGLGANLKELSKKTKIEDTTDKVGASLGLQLDTAAVSTAVGKNLAEREKARVEKEQPTESTDASHAALETAQKKAEDAHKNAESALDTALQTVTSNHANDLEGAKMLKEAYSQELAKARIAGDEGKENSAQTNIRTQDARIRDVNRSIQKDKEIEIDEHQPLIDAKKKNVVKIKAEVKLSKGNMGKNRKEKIKATATSEILDKGWWVANKSVKEAAIKGLEDKSEADIIVDAIKGLERKPDITATVKDTTST